MAFDEAYYQEIRHALEGGGHRWIDVVYEDAVRGDAAESAIVRFLGLEPDARRAENRQCKTELVRSEGPGRELRRAGAALLPERLSKPS